MLRGMGSMLLLITALAVSSAYAPDDGKHALRNENFALHANIDDQKIVDFESFSSRPPGDIESNCNSDQSECTHQTQGGSKITVRNFSNECKIVQHVGNQTDSQQDCFPMESYHWFGGAEQRHQYWPLENFKSLSHSMVPVALENRAVADALWYNSVGTLIFAEKSAPIFYEQNTVKKRNICIVGKLVPPYRPRERLEYKYYVCKLKDAKEAFKYAVNHFINKPSGYPNEDVIRFPIWSTWARYKSHVNETVVREFAKEIKDNGFHNSQLEIDDRWESCYGSSEFDKTRFPNMKKLSDDLHAQGFKITLWTHHFIQLDCYILQEAKAAGYLVADLSNHTESTWWNGKASAIDFTNEKAKQWWIDRHRKTMEDNGIDGYKFDAGETSWMPQLPRLNIAPSVHEDYPGKFTEDYVRACATFGNRTEFRSAHYTQDLPILIRMIDKDSGWGFENGLKTLVTTLLQMNSVGYPMVLPDMIGGNAYGEAPTKELFIRWLQANAFMPAQQYSLVPWDYDAETIKIAKKFADLHDKYTGTIIKAMKSSMEKGTPVNGPIWWLDPTSDDALKENSEFLVGEDILVAPVLENGARARDVYLPKGKWMDAKTLGIHEGPKRIPNYPAPLDTLPYFLRTDNGYATIMAATPAPVGALQPTYEPSSSPGTASEAVTISSVAPTAVLLP